MVNSLARIKSFEHMCKGRAGDFPLSYLLITASYTKMVPPRSKRVLDNALWSARLGSAIHQVGGNPNLNAG